MMTTRLPVPDPLGILTDMSKGREVELFDPIREKLMGEGTPGTREETPEEAWEAWQIYFKEKLYRPALSGHDDYYSQAILAGLSPRHAEALIRRFQAKDPSSFGIDLAADFKAIYERTKHERL